MIAIRSEREINILREANQIVALVHEHLAGMITPGISTRELDKEAERVILANGGIPSFKGYRGYPAATCISVEQEVVHGIPGVRKLVNGDIVSIDIGVLYKGYYGDAAWSVQCGTTDAERQRLLNTTNLALSRAIRAARAGNFLQDIGIAIEQTCKKESYGVVKEFVGHGIGTEMHEDPQVLNFDTGERGVLLREGMVLAIEPMVNMGTHKVKVLRDGWTAVTLDGKPSVHFEHSIVVRPDGGEILSLTDFCSWGTLQEEAA
jgi:methionyl aminopeptidase